jgi:hypothetical protein
MRGVRLVHAPIPPTRARPPPTRPIQRRTCRRVGREIGE